MVEFVESLGLDWRVDKEKQGILWASLDKDGFEIEVAVIFV